MLVSKRDTNDANDVPVSIQFPENVLFVVPNALRTSSNAHASLFFFFFCERHVLEFSSTSDISAFSFPCAVVRTRVGHHEWTVRFDDCISSCDRRRISTKDNKRLFRDAFIIMLFADIIVENKYHKSTAMDILWCGNGPRIN